MRALVIFLGMILFGATSFAQYDYNNTYNGPDRYFYNEDFDWRWDVRVRISDGMNTGQLTNREAKRLYNQLEQIERKEYAFQADGYFSAFEQDEIWNDVTYLNRMIGIELTDWDRTYYGYSVRGLAYRGYSPWYTGSSYDFYRFDRRGYGSISIGYSPRVFFPHNHVYYNNRSYSSNWNNRNDSKRNDRGGDYNRNNSWNNNSKNNRTWGNDKNNNRDYNNRSYGGTLNNSNRSDNKQGSSRGNQSSTYGNQQGKSNNGWNQGNKSSRNNTPNISSQRNSGRNEAPQTSNRSQGSNKREEIMTPRTSPNKSNTSTRNQTSTQENRPNRGNANDSRRGNNQF
ncbi:hypothetical protein EGI22_02330 [Lacihabitans sp. LS3-19]|uniref:hypothetical protein n=1 Tax=Lacihabitans sp. LS3-19 TaxID=2487335 RepID=UPI0020CD0A68|nr:hypothetical protein [Lacihabitans sp. LS3-19]MCP9766729.1 hypothetical protein [Lacihabitans sp. LS3-19]